jgi:hypothetical protein
LEQVTLPRFHKEENNMIDRNFQNWLENSKELAPKSARDVLSRCRRIERTFEISLAETIKTKEDANLLCERLGKESSSLFAPTTNKVYATAVLRRAVNLYSEYQIQLQKSQVDS